MTLTDLLLIYIITTQIVWLLSFIIWEIKPLKPIREPLLVVALFIATPPVGIIMVIGHLIDKLVNMRKKDTETPRNDPSDSQG